MTGAFINKNNKKNLHTFNKEYITESTDHMIVPNVSASKKSIRHTYCVYSNFTTLLYIVAIIYTKYVINK